MPRIKLLEPAAMSPDQARVFNAAKRAGRPLGGPFSAYIRLPAIFEAAQELSARVSASPLSSRQQRIVCMVVARHWNARYPWYRHSVLSLEVGVSRQTVDAINSHETPDLPDIGESTCYRVALEILTERALSAQSFARALEVLGEQSLVALVALVGSFTMSCITAGVFQIEPPDDQPMPLK